MTTQHRQVWLSPGNGDIAALQLQQQPMGELADGDVRVRVRAVGLNFADILAVVGMYSAAPKGPFVPGIEFAGDVIAVGKNAGHWQTGQRVMGSVKFGAYATVIDANADRLQPLPDSWSYAEGAAFFVQTFAAWYALKHLGNAQRDQLVLIHSAAGGVGLQAQRIAKVLGLKTIGTVGNANKKQFLHEQGYDEIIVRGEHFAEQLRDTLRDRPLHLVLDAVGGAVQKASFNALAPTGRLIVYGATVFAPGPRKMRKFHMLLEFLKRPKYDSLSMMSENRGVLAFNLMWLWEQQSFFSQMITELSQLNLPPPYVGTEFPFEKALDAIEFLRSGKSVGKVVLTL